MFQVNNFIDNDDVDVKDSAGCFSVLEYKRDLSVVPQTAAIAYFSSKMNVRKRLLSCNLNGNSVTIQKGAMQWMVGSVKAATGVKGVGDLFGKAIRGKVTGESGIKPEYSGHGMLILEPTYKHIILLDVDEWEGGMVLEDGLFLACDSTLKQSVSARSNMSSAVAGGEGLFNLCLTGCGYVALEARCPKEELIEVVLDNDELKLDGNFAVAWSRSLEFTVERTTKTLIGSAASGEGLVNVFRGSGRILFAPIDNLPV